MPAQRKYPQELRERAIRLVVEARAQEPSLSLTAAVGRIGPRVGVEPAYAKRLGAVGGQQTRSGPDDVGCEVAALRNENEQLRQRLAETLGQQRAEAHKTGTPGRTAATD